MYVYIIKAGPFVKIGHAKSPERRLKTMQTGSPHQMELTAKMPFATKHAAHGYEKELHRRLRKHRYRGEWFHAAGVDLAMRAPANIKKAESMDTGYDQRWMETA